MRNLLLIALSACAFAACGGSDSGSKAPAKITLSASGASPNNVNIPNGGKVTFVNSDAADHQITSSACTEFASPKLSNGGSFTTPALAGARSCGFSDSLNPSATTFAGTVTVAAPGTGGGGGGGGY